ncbi:MAG: hypothetical protein ACI8R4_000256 [Paracoccaceae bacterium]|jgi:hypothetical protein
MAKGLGMRNVAPPMRRIALVCQLLVAGVLSGGLAGCSGGNDSPSLELEVINAGRGLIGNKLAARSAPPRPPLTRAALDTLEGSFLEVTVERRDQLAYLYVSAQRRDGNPGLITVWRTDDDATLTMRNGVLIATRGMGGDILSSLVQVSGTTPGPTSGGERVQYIRAQDNKERRLALVCDLDDLGPETIVIVEQRHPTRHLRETCTDSGTESGAETGVRDTVVNEYWIDSRNQLIWQSRQWAGPDIGYLRTRRLTQ